MGLDVPLLSCHLQVGRLRPQPRLPLCSLCPHLYSVSEVGPAAAARAGAGPDWSSSKGAEAREQPRAGDGREAEPARAVHPGEASTWEDCPPEGSSTLKVSPPGRVSTWEWSSTWHPRVPSSFLHFLQKRPGCRGPPLVECPPSHLRLENMTETHGEMRSWWSGDADF